MIEQEPHDWTFRAARLDGDAPGAIESGPRHAEVPGCVHTDLLAHGLIPDPYLDRNEHALHWIGRSDWLYEARLDVTTKMLGEDRLDLVFDGLDTVAAISLNGVRLGEARNIHHAHRFDARTAAREGENRLAVLLRSNEHAALAEAERLGDLPRVRELPFNFIRKMACNFSWDWGPTLVTAGIWKPCRLEAWSHARIAGVRPLVTSANKERATIDLSVDLEGGGAAVRATLRDPDGAEVARIETKSAGAELHVPSPRLWWPRSHGDQPLYELHAELVRDGEPIDEWRGRIGLRTVALDTGPDEIGSAFTLRVNDRPIFARGANWIPDDCFPTRVTPERLAERLDQAVAANVNLIRVWGGGLYESDEFYDACAERGLMVWQDFPFACAAYPEEAPFPELVEHEAREAVTRLSRHAALVLWNGNNENLWLFFEPMGNERTWEEIVGERGWGTRYYLDHLPRIVAELDPSRPYYPGSPWAGTFERHANDDRHGTNHVWDAWNTQDFTVHRRYRPRFVAEYGHCGPATHATLRRALPVSQLRPDSPGMIHRNRAEDGEAKLARRMEEHVRVPEDFDDWHYVAQLVQARAIRTAAQWHRASAPRTMGTIVWQLNDCWPVTSWAAIDGDGRRKPLWYELRRAYRDRLLTIQPEGEWTGPGTGGALRLVASNETDTTWRGRARLRRVTLGGDVQEERTIALDVPPRATLDVAVIAPAVRPDDAAFWIVEGEDGQRAEWFDRRDRDIAYPEPRWRAHVESEGTTHRVTIEAGTLLRDLALFPDRIDRDAEVDEQLVTLLPGERRVFEVTGCRTDDPEALARHPVLQCANRFGADPGG